MVTWVCGCLHLSRHNGDFVSASCLFFVTCLDHIRGPMRDSYSTTDFEATPLRFELQ